MGQDSVVLAFHYLLTSAVHPNRKVIHGASINCPPEARFIVFDLFLWILDTAMQFWESRVGCGYPNVPSRDAQAACEGEKAKTNYETEDAERQLLLRKETTQCQ